MRVWILGFSLLFYGQVEAVSGTVVLRGAADPDIKEIIEAQLSGVVSNLETGNLSGVADAFTDSGLIAANDLLGRVKLRNARSVHETRLLTLPNGGYEVRDVRVQVGLGQTAGSPYQHLVFTLNENGLIDGVRFAMEQHHYEYLVEKGQELSDFVQLQQIRHIRFKYFQIRGFLPLYLFNDF